MKLRKKILISSAIIMAMLVVLAFSTIDYDLSKTLINKESGFAEFFNIFGELPTSIALLLSTVILFGSRKKEKKFNNVLSIIFGLPFMLLFSFLNIFNPVKYIYEHVENGIPTSVMQLVYVLTLVLFLASLIFIKKMGNEKLRSYRKEAFVLLFLAIGIIFIVNFIKIMWARPRMRSITSINEFKHWYQIAGPTMDDELKSFPSGHTANGFAMIAYTMFFKNLNKKKKIMTFGLVWGALVALSRVILGAHFLSDVIVGGYITIVLFFVLEYLFIKKGEQCETGNI